MGVEMDSSLFSRTAGMKRVTKIGKGECLFVFFG